MICKECLCEMSDEEILKAAAAISGRRSAKADPRERCKRHGIFLNREGKCTACEKWENKK
jgi:hypothetical protein